MDMRYQKHASEALSSDAGKAARGIRYPLLFLNHIYSNQHAVFGVVLEASTLPRLHYFDLFLLC
jgi:hypothetical protein